VLFVGQPPSLQFAISPPSGALLFAGKAPNVKSDYFIVVPTGALVFSGLRTGGRFPSDMIVASQSIVEHPRSQTVVEAQRSETVVQPARTEEYQLV
jgi:hypothetical protein